MVASRRSRCCVAAGLVLCRPDRIADGLLRGLLLAEHDEPGLPDAADVLHLVLEVALDPRFRRWV